MSESLAIKYRPKNNWNDLKEQESIKKILSYQIKTNTVKNAYLFTGPAGCGKTTSARIFASMINNGEGLPIELDAASNNGVDDIRRICEDAQTKSLDSLYKVFILDEVHVLSSSAWQAMLKTLEEPPKYSIFILCTTNPEKIPATILSRVQRYNFQRISLEGIVTRLEYIVNREQNTTNEFWNIDRDALVYLARIAEGGMRDAITLMDKCLSYSKELSVENVVKALGVANYDDMISLNNCIFSRDLPTLFNSIEYIYADGIDLKQFMKNYFEFLLDILKFRVTEDWNIMKIPNTYSEEIESYGDYEYSTSQSLLKLVLEINHEIKWEKDVKSYIQAKLALFMIGE